MPQSFARRACSLSCSLMLVSSPMLAAAQEAEDPALPDLPEMPVDEDTGALNPRLVDAPASTEPELERLLHKTIKKVGECIDLLQMNTAISQMMIFTNLATSSATLPRCRLNSLNFRSSSIGPEARRRRNCRRRSMMRGRG